MSRDSSSLNCNPGRSERDLMSSSVAAREINSAVSPTGNDSIALTRAMYSSVTDASEISLISSLRFSISSKRTSRGPSYTGVLTLIGIFFYQCKKQADRRAGSAFGQVLAGGRGHARRDIKVEPRAVELFGKDFQKLSARYHAAIAAVARGGDVGHVAEVAFDHVVVLLPERERPYIVAALLAQRPDVLHHVLAVGHQRRGVQAQRGQCRAGERSGIGDYCGSVALGVGNGVGQDDAPLGIGVEYLDAFTRERLEYVAGAQGTGSPRVFHCGDKPHHVCFYFYFGRKPQLFYPRRSARHVHMHLVHMVAGLYLYPAGVKSNPLSHQHHRIFEGSRTSLTTAIFHDDKLRLVFGAFADAQDRAHTKLLHLLHSQHFYRKFGACPASFRCGLSRSSKLLRGHISARRVGKLAGRIDLARDNQTVGKTLFSRRGHIRNSDSLDKVPTILRLSLVKNMFVV